MEDIKLDFETAKRKHLLFKSQLRSILYGVETDVVPVMSEFECGVGKWIYNHALHTYSKIPEVRVLERVHADLHAIARELVKLYNEDKKELARAGLIRIEETANKLIILLDTIEKKVLDIPVEEASS
jgi:hypothetical protein